MKDRVSVIIPTYNYARFVEEAITSVLAQTLPVSEIIVVDDGSTDNTEEIVTKFGGIVKYIKQKNSGVGQARNTGVKHSTGNFLAFLDADDLWLPSKIDRQLEYFKSSDNNLGLVTTGMREFDKAGKTICEHLEGKNGWCANDLLLFRSVVIGPGSTSLLKRKVFEKVGGFDTNREMHPSEDWEFSYRVARKFKIAYIPEILVEYRNHGNNGHLQIPRFERAMKLAYEKTFNNESTEVKKLKKQAYGNFHRVLAGCYFQNGEYDKFFNHTIKSFWLTPSNIAYFAKYPLRKLRKLYLPEFT